MYPDLLACFGNRLCRLYDVQLSLCCDSLRTDPNLLACDLIRVLGNLHPGPRAVLVPEGQPAAVDLLQVSAQLTKEFTETCVLAIQQLRAREVYA
ncbi:hypothetical protein SSPIM334S_03070 [Streptomyces spiroverticillatus]